MSIKRVALITPPYHSGVVESAGTWLNVGFVYIAGSLRAAGYEVDYYDAMSLWHKWPEIEARIRAFNPDVVATTAYTASIVHALELTALAKKINPDIVTVHGNVHATFCYDEMLTSDHDTVDFIVRGEGEVTLVSLLDCLNAGGDPAQVPGLAFQDAAGKPLTLADWRGRTILLNLWATWCVPCRKEMPALDSLQTRLGGPDFEVVAVNIDTRDLEKPKNFLKDANLTRLGYFTDQKAKVFQDLKAIGRALGMPTSVLVDGQGCEIATIAGPAEWASDDAIKLIKAAMVPATAGF